MSPKGSAQGEERKGAGRSDRRIVQYRVDDLRGINIVSVPPTISPLRPINIHGMQPVIVVVTYTAASIVILMKVVLPRLAPAINDGKEASGQVQGCNGCRGEVARSVSRHALSVISNPFF